jgi:hypothetical protein
MSFAQEIKDFTAAYEKGEKINASQTDQEYKKALMDATQKKTLRDNDPDTLARADEMEKTKLENLRSQISSRNALTGARVKLYNQRGVVGDPTVAPEDAAIGGAVAGSVAQPFVPAYAEGGLVGDDEDATNTAAVDDTGDGGAGGDIVNGVDEEADGAVPTPAVGGPQPGMGGMTDVSARSRTPAQGGNGSLSMVSPQLVHDATKGGLAYGATAMGLHARGGVMTRAQQAKALAYARGYGALPPAELDKVKKAVDPDSKLSEAQRNMAALGAVFQYQMNKGNPEGAQRAAFQVLQAYRLDSMRYAAIAAHAAQDGNIDLATQAAVKAYANIPDGNDIHLQKGEDGKIMFSYTDGATGKVIQKGLITPQQLAAQATGLAQDGFDKAILSAAGQREAAKAKPQMKVSDIDKLSTAAQGAVEDGLTKLEKDGTPISDNSKRLLSGTTFRILKNNLGGLTPNEAFVASRDMLGNTNKDAFKIKKDDDGNNIVTFGPKSALGAGYKLKLDDDALEPIIASRAAMLADQKKKTDEASATSERRSNLVTRAGKAVGAVGSAIADDLSIGEDAPALREDAPLSKVGRFARNSLLSLRDGVRNAGAVETAPLDYQGEQTP